MTIALSLISLTVSKADEEYERNKDILDSQLYVSAPVVVRAWVKSPGEGSKYLWADIQIRETVKAPKGINIPAELQVAHQSTGKGLPSGLATLYLELYDQNKPESGWQLVERFDPKTRKLSKGYSHHKQEANIHATPLVVFAETFAKVASHFERSKIQTTWGGFYLRADNQQHFDTSEFEPSPDGFWLGGRSLPVKDLKAATEAGPPAAYTEKKIGLDFPTGEREDSGLMITLRYGSKCDDKVVSELFKAIEALKKLAGQPGADQSSIKPTERVPPETQLPHAPCCAAALPTDSVRGDASTRLRTVLRSEIIASFRYYIHLNHELERIAKLEGMDSPKGLAVLKAMSAYGGDDGKSAMEYNLQLFSIMLNANREDSDLVGEFLQMFVVHQLRSANEDVSLLTAKLYSEHRDIFDKAIKSLPEDKQAVVKKFIAYRSDGPNINDQRDQRTGIEAVGEAKNH